MVSLEVTSMYSIQTFLEVWIKCEFFLIEHLFIFIGIDDYLKKNPVNAFITSDTGFQS